MHMHTATASMLRMHFYFLANVAFKFPQGNQLQLNLENDETMPYARCSFSSSMNLSLFTICDGDHMPSLVVQTGSIVHIGMLT